MIYKMVNTWPNQKPSRAKLSRRWKDRMEKRRRDNVRIYYEKFLSIGDVGLPGSIYFASKFADKPASEKKRLAMILVAYDN